MTWSNSSRTMVRSRASSCARRARGEDPLLTLCSRLGRRPLMLWHSATTTKLRLKRLMKTVASSFWLSKSLARARALVVVAADADVAVVELVGLLLPLLRQPPTRSNS